MVNDQEINQLYNKLVGRDCDDEILKKLIRNKFSLDRIERSILHSDEYKERRNVIFNFDKWVKFGERYTYVLKDKEFTEPPVTCNNNLVFIDFRYLDNMEFVIRNALLRLDGTFMVTFVCGPANYDDVKILCSEISENIKVVKVDEHVNSNKDYNKLLLDKEFWKMLDGEKILIHQFDAFILKNNIEEFLTYNYLGSPCYYKGEELIYNGGFSIRTKQVMIDLLEIHKPKDISEDIFFSRNIKINKEISTKFAFQEEETDAFGCHQMWKVREFSHSEFYDKLKYEKSDIYKYPNLFHKFVLGIRNPYDPIKYEVKQEYFEQKELVAHLHCYDIEKFDEFYGYKIEEIVKYYFTIVTFSKGNYKGGIDNVVVLKHENRGADVGGKFVCNRYLKDIDYDYTHILMLHSKTNKGKRKMFYSYFIDNIEETLSLINENYDAYVPPIIMNSNIEFLYKNRRFTFENDLKTKWDRNSMYMNEIEKYMKLPDYFKLFSEGNVYILSKKIFNFCFSDLKLFNTLNTSTSFDFCWTKTYYKLDSNITDVYSNYQKNNLYGNNFETGLGWKGLADCMIEHTFERIIFGVCKKFNKGVYIIKNDQTYLSSESISKFILTGDINLLRTPPITIIACHTNSDLKVKCIKVNLKYFSKISEIIYIVNSKGYEGKIEEIIDNEKFIINDVLTYKQAQDYRNLYEDLNEANLDYNQLKNHWVNHGKFENRYIKGYKRIYIDYLKNDKNVCQGKWYNTLSKMKNVNSSFILTNDSFLIINKLDNFTNKISKNYDMVTIVDSNEVKYHFADFLRYYSSKGINKLMEFYRENFKKCDNFRDVIVNLEMNSTFITENRYSVYKMKTGYNKNVHFDDEYYEKYLDDGYPIIKIKKILFNKYESFPTDFNPDEYKRLHIDLTHMENKEATEHFKIHGFREGRPYKKNQKNVLPKYLEKYVTSLGLQRIR